MADSMQFQDVSANVRGIALAAIVEAQRQGVVVVEAEHLLLALAADRHTAAGRFLVDHRLSHAELLDALRVERERSLIAVGVQPRDLDGLAATRIQRPRWGASTRNTFERASKIASRFSRGRHRMTAFDLLYGLFRLELGTVPRALAFAGIDRAALLADVIDTAGMGDMALVVD